MFLPSQNRGQSALQDSCPQLLTADAELYGTSVSCLHQETIDSFRVLRFVTKFIIQLRKLLFIRHWLRAQ
jgi:hypothetical protein